MYDSPIVGGDYVPTHGGGGRYSPVGLHSVEVISSGIVLPVLAFKINDSNADFVLRLRYA